MTLVNTLPWLMSLVTIYTMFLAGEKKSYTWAIGLFNQALWLVWIIASSSWGLIPMNLALWVVYTRNHLKWNSWQMTPAMNSALLWLRNRNADGVFDKHQVLIAAGEKAPFIRSTWNKLKAEGCVEFYMNDRRARVTDKGFSVNMTGVVE